MPPRRRAPTPGPSLEGLAGTVIGFTAVYLGAEAALPGALHPLHWVVTLRGGGIGYAVGHALSLWKDGMLFVRDARDGRRNGRNPGSRRDRRGR